MESVHNLYITYEKYIFRYLYSLTLDYHQAEELTQETFFRVVKSIPRFRQDAHVSTWIYGIARNVYLEWIRKKRNQQSAWMRKRKRPLMKKETSGSHSSYHLSDRCS
ncbi:MAG: RNA polymerase sigma factor [Bacillota bacterium]|nr:RNA polymerase sigma factor [Bacillota bacterium]